MTQVAEGSVIAGKYRLDRPLARGGMGSVWVAHHVQLDSPVAIKFMAPEYASAAQARARFELEAKAAAQLRHPNVVQIHDYGVDGSTPYIVMELLEGEDLGTRLKRQRRFTPLDAAAVLTQAARALSRAHAAGIVHRDLKPNNLFLASSDEIEIVKVLDFGIAKASLASSDGEELTTSGTMLGSPNYMSPEQARGHRDADHRSDLWSLAAILFRMLTGETAFRGDAAGDVIVKICTGPLPVPSAIAPELSTGIDRFFRRAMARDPQERFQSAREMAIEFASVVGATASWTDPGASYRGPRPVLVEIIPDGRPSDSGTLDKASSVRNVPAARGVHPSLLWASGIGAALIVGTLVWRLLAMGGGAADRASSSARPPLVEAPSAAASVAAVAGPTAVETASTAEVAEPAAPPEVAAPETSASAARAAATASALPGPAASSRTRRLKLGF